LKSALLLSLAITWSLQDPAVDLKVGDPAPAFDSVDDAGMPWKSADHVGKRIVVVYFYPASFTGGCTGQAIAFQSDMKKFKDQDVEIVGVSGDAVKTQEAFKKLYKLDFAILSDGKGDVAKQFGVPVKPGGKFKQKIGDTVEEFTRDVTLARWTFVIGRDGKIVYKNTKVNPTQDSKAVLEILAKLQ